jgi:hypothetical protein
MSLTFRAKKGSVEILNVFWRWGWRQNVLSQRWTVLLEIPVSAARERALHWVLPSLGYSFGEGFA